MPFFGVPLRNGLPLGLGSTASLSSGVGFSPSELFAGGQPGAWYDPSDSSTLFSDTAGTTPVAEPGAGAQVVVGRMLDKSGNGNHAQAYNSTTARPELSARVNLLTYSEDFSNGTQWTRANINAFGSGSVANTTVTLDPLGGNTADYIQENTANDFHFVYSAIQTFTSGVSYTLSVSAKKAERSAVVIQLPTAAFGANTWAIFDLDTGTVSAIGAGSPTASIVSQGNGWYRCTITKTATSTSSTNTAFIYINNSTSTWAAYTGTGTSGIYIWGADLRPANIGANVPAYQRIADQYTYDNGPSFPRYLRFDGVDDGMSTPANLNLSSTDKATVFAGVRKLSSTSGIIVELSANVQTNAGSFVLGSALSTAAAYNVQVNGSARNARGYETYSAPVSNVLSSSITTTAADSAAAMQTRVDGAVNAGISLLSVASTGNYSAYPLYIGARGNASLWFNGYLYSLIVRGADTDAGTISATETWVGNKTGIVVP